MHKTNKRLVAGVAVGTAIAVALGTYALKESQRVQERKVSRTIEARFIGLAREADGAAFRAQVQDKSYVVVASNYEEEARQYRNAQGVALQRRDTGAAEQYERSAKAATALAQSFGSTIGLDPKVVKARNLQDKADEAALKAQREARKTDSVVANLYKRAAMAQREAGDSERYKIDSALAESWR